MTTATQNLAFPGTGHILWQLIKKDWYFVAIPMAAYLVLGLAAAALMSVPSYAAFMVGSVVLISAVIIVGVHLVFGTVTHERTKQTLPLILSLPVTFFQYSVAKLVSNLVLYLLAWGALVAFTLVLIATRENLPAGLTPFAVIVLTELFAAYVVTLAVAMISESEILTIVVLSTLNVGVSVFMNLVGARPEIGSHMEGPVAVWNSTALTILGIELLIIVAAIAITLFVQSRKTDFL